MFSTLHDNCILGVVRLLSQRTLLVACLLVVSVVAFADILLSASAQSVLQATSTTTVTITTTTTRTSTTGTTTTTTLTSTTYSPYIFPTLTTTVTLTTTSTVSWYGPSTPLVGLALLSTGSLWCFYSILPVTFLWVGSRRLIQRNSRRWWRRNVWLS